MRKPLDPTRKPMRSPSIPSKEILEALLTECQNIPEVCRRLNYSVKSDSLIYMYMKMYGLANPGDRFDRLRATTSLTDHQKSIIVGMLLGDASIPSLRRRDRNYGLSFTHTSRQAAYGEWKNQMFAPLNRSPSHLRISRKAGEEKKYEAFIFQTLRHPDFAEFRHLFYPEGKKIVPPNIADLLTIEGVAIWYMDDGHLHPYRWRTGIGYCCEFASQSFSEEGNALLAATLNRLCGINVRLMYKSGTAGGSGVLLTMNNANSHRFAELVYPHFHPSMLYKLPPSGGRSFLPPLDVPTESRSTLHHDSVVQGA